MNAALINIGAMAVMIYLEPDHWQCLLQNVARESSAETCLKAGFQFDPASMYRLACDKGSCEELLRLARIHCPDAAPQLARALQQMHGAS
jgi:hypothetical protein